MPIFQYRAYDSLGKEVLGSIEAVSVREAAERVRKDGLFPRDLRVQGGQGGALTRRRPVSLNDLAAATRQLSSLLSSGTTLFDALTLLVNEEENVSLKGALIAVKDGVTAGSSLSSALEAHPGIFPEIYVRAVEAGEAGGALDGALIRLSEYLDARARVYARVRTALIYPALMLVVGAGVLFFLFLFVVPKITSIFEDTKSALPLVTRVLVAMVHVVTGYWPLLVLAGAGLSFAGWRAIKTPGGMGAAQRFLLGAPFLGKLFTRFYMANFARTLGSLLSSGVPIINALEMTRRVLHHSVFDEALARTVMEVTEGATLSASMRKTGAFPGILTHMVATGERSGELDKLLLKSADNYEREFEVSVERSLSLLEPAIVLVMGVVVGFIVLAILLPIFELNQVIR
ncbi:MAG: type II secretion system F family protein [Deltaproteobacteria bacterium]|nr:type II secretion system F family protein [Deltaproteobacteria bacterium]